MIGLLKNEIYKIFKMKKLYIFVAINLAIIFLNLYNYVPGSQNTVWTFSYGQSAPIILADIFSQLMIIFIPIIVADSLAHDYRQGTLKLSLIRPISRTQLLVSKIASLFIFIFIMMIIHIITSYAAGTFFLGWGNGTEYAGQMYASSKGILITIIAYSLLMVPYMVYGLLAALFAVFLNNMSLTILISLVLMIVLSNLSVFEAITPYSLGYQIAFFYEIFIPHFNRTTGFISITVMAVCLCVFTAITFLIFRKKEILY